MDLRGVVCLEVPQPRGAALAPGAAAALHAVAALGADLPTEYMLITDMVNNPTTAADVITVVRNTAPKGLKSLPTTVTVPAGTASCIMPLGNPADAGAAATTGAQSLSTPTTAVSTATGTKPGRSNSMISTSMRAIVELSPREPIEWVVPEEPAVPAPPLALSIN